MRKIIDGTGNGARMEMLAGLHLTIEFPGIQFDEVFRKNCLQSGIYITRWNTAAFKKAGIFTACSSDKGIWNRKKSKSMVLLHDFIKAAR